MGMAALSKTFEPTYRKRRELTPLHFQLIPHRGACGKTRVVPQNGWPGQESTETGNREVHVLWPAPATQSGADDVNPLTTSAFDLPDRLFAKADPALIAGDERHFAALAESLEQSIADLSDRLDAE